MIYITLPEFYFNFNIINLFSKLPKHYFKTDLSFSASSGNFPYCYWNGGFNNNTSKLALYHSIHQCIDNIRTPIRFNCSNIYLTKDDLDDTMANLILKIGETGSNEIAISNLEFYEILKEKYPNYKFVFSREADLIYPMTSEIINLINEQNIFKFIEIPEVKVKDFEFLKAIKQKNKIELPINTLCNFDCYSFKNCKYHEHKSQYDYSQTNNYINCSMRQGYDEQEKILITLEEIIEKYLPLGINHFSLAPIMNSQKDSLLIFLINYFVKEEYHNEIYNIILKDKIKND